MSPVAIIPARGGSKRLPRKNIAELGGKPMLAYPVEAALQSGMFERVIVSTEDKEIALIAEKAGAEVHKRPQELASDTATVTQVCERVLAEILHQECRTDFFCCIYATAAFVTVEDLKLSFSLIRNNDDVEVVMGVSSYPIHPYRALWYKGEYLCPVWPDKNELDSKVFPGMFASNGTLYWARTEYFMNTPDFYANRLVGYVMPPERAVDIDSPEDLAMAKRLARGGA